jgi:hypothetical protein
MAKTLKIYPISDASLNHDVYPSNTSNGYTLVYDVTSDDNTTYIYHKFDKTTSTKTSSFKCGDNSVSKKIYLRSISYLFRGMYNTSDEGLSSVSSVTANVIPTVSINGGASANGNQASMTTSYTNYSGSFSNVSGLNTIYNSIFDANIVFGLQTSGLYTMSSDSKTANVQLRITQANLTITYDDVFDCSASVVVGTGISSVSVSKSEAVDGDIVTFTATLIGGVAFDGWYSDSACTNKVSSNATYQTTITQDTTLYAKGDFLYDVNVVADSYCTVSTTAAQATYGTSVTVTATVTGQNRMFEGWYSNPQRTTLVSTDNPYTFSVTDNVTLYASTRVSETLYVKVNGQWAAVSKAFRKVNGQWVEQTTLNNLFDTTKNYKIIKVN